MLQKPPEGLFPEIRIRYGGKLSHAKDIARRPLVYLCFDQGKEAAADAVAGVMDGGIVESVT